jgi:hypothetical protein
MASDHPFLASALDGIRIDLDLDPSAEYTESELWDLFLDMKCLRGAEQGANSSASLIE